MTLSPAFHCSKVLCIVTNVEGKMSLVLSPAAAQKVLCLPVFSEFYLPEISTPTSLRARQWANSVFQCLTIHDIYRRQIPPSQRPLPVARFPGPIGAAVGDTAPTSHILRFWAAPVPPNSFNASALPPQPPFPFFLSRATLGGIEFGVLASVGL